MARCVTVDHGKATQPRQREFYEQCLTHLRILPSKQPNHTAQIRLAMPARGVQAHQFWSASAASGLALSVSRASLTALSRFFSRVAILAKSLGLFEAISKSRGNMRHKQPRHITQHTPLNTSHNMCLHLAPETVVTYDFMYTNQKPKKL